MVNICKGICIKYKAIGYEGKFRYEMGQKMCSICTEFLTYPGVRCPCCGVLLRSTPRGNKARKEIHVKRNRVWQ